MEACALDFRECDLNWTVFHSPPLGNVFSGAIVGAAFASLDWFPLLVMRVNVVALSCVYGHAQDWCPSLPQ